MGLIRIREQSPTLAVTFAEESNPGGPNKGRRLGTIGHPTRQGDGIDWKKTAENVRSEGNGLVIELVER